MDRLERLWLRYWKIADHHGNGDAMPILRHLAFRGHVGAMTTLSSILRPKGRIADPFSQIGLAYRAYRRGDPFGAHHLAMNGFNRRDLANYRYWLARAARAGDAEAGASLRRFEVRLPHRDARTINRGRPFHFYD
jgi:TPR repeat protein